MAAMAGVTEAEAPLGVPDWLGPLSGAERQVWRAFPRGRFVDLRCGDADTDDPARADGWGPSRCLRAEVIAALLLGARAPTPGRITALRLAGARITGTLDLAHGKIAVPCVLRYCRFDGPVDLEAAQAVSLDVRGSRFVRIRANSAHIDGRLNLSDTVITGPGSFGLRADGIVVDGALIAPRMVVTGLVSVINGAVREQLVLRDGRLSNPGGIALNLGGLHVGRSLYLTWAVADGEVRLPGLHAGSALVLDGATLRGDGVALFAEAMNVTGDLSAQHVTATGQVVLRSSRIGGSVLLHGAALHGPPGPAPGPPEPVLRAERMTVGTSVHLCDGFTTTGEVRLTGTRLGHLHLGDMTAEGAQLTLFAVQTDAISDGDGPWAPLLNIDGLVYRDLSPYRPARDRIKLLEHQVASGTSEPGGYRAQPFEQLAAYYRSLGHNEEARTVLLAKERMRTRTMPWPRRIPGWLLDVAAGYGYRPQRAAAWAAGLLAFATAFFAHFRPVRVQSGDSAAYNPLIYAIDQVVPLVHLGQQDAFQSRGFAGVVATALSLAGWTLGIAIAAAVTRKLTSN